MSSYTNESDELLIANITEKPPFPAMFNSKQWSWNQDSNNGVYQSNLTYNLNSNAGAGFGLVLSEAHLWIPCQVTLTLTGVVSGPYSYAVGMKGSSLTFIDSIQTASLNGIPLVTQNLHQCFLASFQQLINSDTNAVRVKGATYGLIPDSAGSTIYSTTYGSVGNIIGNGLSSVVAVTGAVGPVGVANALPTSAQVLGLPLGQYAGIGAVYKSSFNLGLLQKIQATTAFSPSSTDVGSLVTDQDCITLGQNYNENTSQTVTKFYFTRVIRLGDLSDIFAKLDFPIQNVRLFLQLNFNAVTSCSWTQAPSTANAAMGQGTTIMTNGVADIMLTSVVPNIASLSAITVAEQVGNTMANYTRIYVPQVQLSPKDNERLLRDQIRKVDFLTVNGFQYTNQTAQSNFNQTLGTNFRRPVRMTVFMSLAAQASGMGNFQQFQLLQDPCGGYTWAPYVSLSNIVVSINNLPLSQFQQVYNFESFVENVLPEQKDNLDYSSSGAGLIGEDFWKANKVYVFDVSRTVINQPPNQLNSLSLQAKINSAQNLDLWVFIESLSSINVNMISGNVEYVV